MMDSVQDIDNSNNNAEAPPAPAEAPAAEEAAAPPEAPARTSTSSEKRPSFADVAISQPTASGAAPFTHKTPDCPFEISVSDPQKHGEGSMHAYISYKVTTQTSMPQFKHSQFSVVRRYRDFNWLAEQLQDKYPGLIIPPIPEKILVGRFSAENIESRRRALELFLNRVAAHALLRESVNFQSFLESSDESFAQHKDTVAKEKKKTDFVQGAKEIWTAFSNKVVKDKAEVQGDEELTSMRTYVSNLENQMSSAHKYTEKLVKRRKDLATGLSEFGLAFTLLGNNEKGNLNTALTKLGSTVEKISAMSHEQADKEVEQFEEHVKDYCRIVASFKEAVKARSTSLITLQTVRSDLESAKAKQAKLRGQPGKEEKALAMDKEVEAAEKNLTLAEEAYDTIVKRTNEEMLRFQSEKLQDFKAMIMAFVKLQVEYTQKIQAAWEALVPEIESISVQE